VAHNPSDAMVRLLHVALSGVLMLCSLVIAASGLVLTVGAREPGGGAPLRSLGIVLLAVGGAGFLVSGGRTLWLVIDWRRHRGERSHRP
jgi:hypothetical protein